MIKPKTHWSDVYFCNQFLFITLLDMTRGKGFHLRELQPTNLVCPSPSFPLADVSTSRVPGTSRSKASPYVFAGSFFLFSFLWMPTLAWHLSYQRHHTIIPPFCLFFPSNLSKYSSKYFSPFRRSSFLPFFYMDVDDTRSKEDRFPSDTCNTILS